MYECIVHWQDNDSSSAKAVKESFPAASVMLCGGHIARAHHNKLKSLQVKKSLTKNDI